MKKSLDYFVKRKIQIQELELNNVPEDFINKEKLELYEEALIEAIKLFDNGYNVYVYRLLTTVIEG